MKIVLLSSAASIHTVRWANGLCEAGHEVHLVSQRPALEGIAPSVQIYLFANLGVAGYFFMVPGVRKLLMRIEPDIVNAHYASGYGTTARLVNYQPWVLSVWGSDVYDFPYISALHGWLIKKNLRAANQIASTSHCMARQTRSLVPEISDIAVTAFGVDLAAYSSVPPLVPRHSAKVVIGTVKTMSPKYGIDTLIESFALLRRSLGSGKLEGAPDVELRLVGGGEQTEELRGLATRLGVGQYVCFVGQVPHREVPSELAKMDIYVALSRLESESFGVAVIEAGAAGRPVVVSDAGGLPEVTINGVTGLVVPREDAAAAADALEKLVLDADLRSSMGIAGRDHVSRLYSWDTCVQTMVGVYERTIEQFHGKSK